MIQYGGQHSGKGGTWVMRGPFGNTSLPLESSEGFSINGGHRSNSYIGRDRKFSVTCTPFRGTEPRGNGGSNGDYKQAQPVYNAGPTIVDIRGNQHKYVKPSVLSTTGMIATKYRWIRGVYPNVWVQPLYTGNQVDSGSQGLYVQTKSAANACVTDINNPDKYDGNIVNRGPTLCKKTTAGFTFNQMTSNAPYTKNLKMAVTSSEHLLRVQRTCSVKHFPYAVQTGKGIGASGGRVSSGGNGCGTSNPVLRAPII